MRQKNIKGLTKAHLSELGVEVEPKKLALQGACFLEIGSGKGQFITALALDHRDQTFIAFEVNKSVCYRIAQKKESLKLNNLIIVLDDASHLHEYIDIPSIDGIYLNFSDPWPKAKHHKRRLTHPSFLTMYQSVLKENAFIQFRTDHYELFLDSLGYLESLFLITQVDLKLEPTRYMTEYEEKKRVLGPIYQVVARGNIDETI